MTAVFDLRSLSSFWVHLSSRTKSSSGFLFLSGIETATAQLDFFPAILSKSIQLDGLDAGKSTVSRSKRSKRLKSREVLRKIFYIPGRLHRNCGLLHGNSNRYAGIGKAALETQIPVPLFGFLRRFLKSGAGNGISCTTFSIAKQENEIPVRISKKRYRKTEFPHRIFKIRTGKVNSCTALAGATLLFEK